MISILIRLLVASLSFASRSWNFYLFECHSWAKCYAWKSKNAYSTEYIIYRAIAFLTISMNSLVETILAVTISTHYNFLNGYQSSLVLSELSFAGHTRSCLCLRKYCKFRRTWNGSTLKAQRHYETKRLLSCDYLHRLTTEKIQIVFNCR